MRECYARDLLSVLDPLSTSRTAQKYVCEAVESGSCARMEAIPTSFGDSKQFPGIRGALKRVRAAIAERETGPRNQILYGARDENLLSTRSGLDARREVHGQAGYIVSVPFDFAGMKARTNLQPEPPYIVSERNGAADRPCWSVERGE